MITINAEILYRIFKQVLSISKYKFILEITHDSYYIVISDIGSHCIYKIPFIQMLGGRGTYVLPNDFVIKLKTSTLKEILQQEQIQFSNDASSFSYLDIEYQLEKVDVSYCFLAIDSDIEFQPNRFKVVSNIDNELLKLFRLSGKYIYLLQSSLLFSNDYSIALSVTKLFEGLCGVVNLDLYLNCFLPLLGKSLCYVDIVHDCIYSEVKFPNKFKDLKIQSYLYSHTDDSKVADKFYSIAYNTEFVKCKELDIDKFYIWVKRNTESNVDGRVRLAEGYIGYEMFKEVFGRVRSEQQLGGLKSVSSWMSEKLIRLDFISIEDTKYSIYFAKLRQPE